MLAGLRCILFKSWGVYAVMWMAVACTQQKNDKTSDIASKAILRQVPASPYVVPADSIKPLRTVKAGVPQKVLPVNVKIVPANLNVRAVLPASARAVVRWSTLPQFTPGTDTVAFPAVISIKGRVVNAAAPEVVLVKDAYTKDLNPGNFSSFIKLQGLKHGNVNVVLQDSKGNLWFGTDGGGASRYDGKYFTHFTEPAGLTNNVVRCMLEDKHGNLWFGTDAGLTKYDGETFTQYTKQEGLPATVIRSIIQDLDNRIWLASDEGITCYNGKTFTHYTTRQGLVNNTVYSFIQDHHGTYWIGTGGGVCCFDGKTFTHLNAHEGIGHPVIRALYQDSNGVIWIGTEGGGVSCYNGKEIIRYTEKEGLWGNKVCSVMEDKKGRIWMGTEGTGICCYTGTEFIHFTDREGLSSNSVLCSTQDKSGNIWFGTYGGGVSRYDGNVLTHITESEGISNSVVRAVLKDKNGNLWFGTNGGGASYYDGKNFTWYSENTGLGSDVVRSLLQDKNGNIWLGTHGGGVTMYDGKYYYRYTEKEGLSHSVVRCIFQDKDNNIWFGTYGKGITKFDGTHFTYFTTKEGLSHDVILTIMQDRDGRMWFGTEGGGVTVYDGKWFTHIGEKQGMSNKDVWSIVQDEDGKFWFATGGGGISLYDGRRFTHITEKEGLSNNFVFSILRDREGNFWFGTRFGLNKLSKANANRLVQISGGGLSNAKYKKDEVFFKSYTHENGFLGIGCFGNAICEDNRGDIWIGTNDRLTVYHPAGDEADTIPPNIQITQVQLFNENVPWTALSRNEKAKDTTVILGNGVEVSEFTFDGITRWYGLPHNLNLAYNNNFLTFRFIGIEQKQPGRVKYTYKLDGLDENWSSIDTRTEATYGNLSHGTYTFKVKAMNGEGFWSKTYNYTFTIRPPWWQTTWFRILLGGSVIVLLYAFYRWRTASMRKRQRVLEQTVKNRTAEVVQQKEEAEKQRRMVERKQRELTDSINYAKRIQEAILPPMRMVKEWFPHSFILYKPKDIIAGDFYFFETSATHIYYAAADCTGHGVPGAMVSVVCSNALTRCVKEFELTDPGQILNKTRELVIETFEKSAADVRDGMDISLMVMDKKTRKVSWAGANNPLWILNKDATEVREISSDKQSISKTDKPKPFTTHQVALSSGSTLYLFTDGYADQFGGNAQAGKKFKASKMKELLIKIQEEDMDAQRLLINQAFEDWRGSLEQIDDVCVIGIRL